MKLLIAILISTFAFAKIKAAVAVRDKLSCSADELERRDCELESGKLKLNLYHGKWRFADGVTMAVHDLPTGDLDVKWKVVRLHLKGGRRLLEYSAWSPPAGDGEVQTLIWHVIEVSEREPKVHVAEIVQRRKTIDERGPASQVDPPEKHGLRFTKTGTEWYAGRRKGSI